MQESDKKAFAELIAGVYAYHRTPVSPAIISVYWRGCQRWTMEQVTKAIDSLTQDAEAGKFVPKIGDVTRVLEGTHTDRSMLAWGKTLEAMSAVGAYQDVVFDDPAIHAVIEDLGGWPKVCRTEMKDLGYVQHRFCEGHRAYTGRGEFEYPRRLGGARDADEHYKKVGLKPPVPMLVGNPAACRQVFEGGNTGGKTKVTFGGAAMLGAPRLAELVQIGRDTPAANQSQPGKKAAA